MRRKFRPQIDDPNYFTMPYLSRERWISFWYQILEVTESHPTSILEIGPGPGVVSHILQKMGISVATLDIDGRLKPNICADITALPFSDKAFDTVLAAETLEHIPFLEVSIALSEMARVARSSIVITLPHFHHFAPSIALKLFPFVPRFSKVFPISFPTEHKFDGQHYWEIGKRGFPTKRITQVLVQATDFHLTREYILEENPYHHIFILAR